MCYSEGNVYVIYFLMNFFIFEILYIDIIFVVVYFYLDMQFKILMKDMCIGFVGLWNVFNGIFKVEFGDMYIMFNFVIVNGFL